MLQAAAGSQDNRDASCRRKNWQAGGIKLTET